MDVFDRKESNVRYYSRSYPVIFDKAEGETLIDENGRRYLDFLSGAGTLNYGHNNPVIKKKLIEYVQGDGIVHGLDMSTTAKRDFLEVMEGRILKPRQLPYKVQFTAPTGTNAVEASLKLARKVKQRTNIVAFTNAFHGNTAGSVSATGNSFFRRGAGIPLNNVTFMPYDGYFGQDVDSLVYIRKLLSNCYSGVDLPAAIILETIQGEGGINVASTAWMLGVQALCRELDILLIVDDIQVGCGRTGTFFSFEKTGLQPDMVLLSKSLSGFGLPFSVMLLKPELDQWQPGEHNGTFRGNNLAFVTAAETIRHYWSDTRFSQEIASKAERLTARLKALCERHSDSGMSYRGRGLIQGLEMANSEQAEVVKQFAFDNGLIIETCGGDQVVKFLSPLTVSDENIEKAMDIVDAGVARALQTGGQKGGQS